MNVTLANTINFTKDSLNLAKETAVNYGGRAITQLKHLPVTMHEDFKVACAVTATVTAVALVAGNYLGNKISKQTKNLVAGELTFGATLAITYAGLSYATGFPQNKTVSALIVVSLTALRCFLTISKIQSRFLTAEKERDDLQKANNKLKEFNSKFMQEQSDFNAEINALKQERDVLQANEDQAQQRVKALQEKVETLEKNITILEQSLDLKKD